MTKDKVINKLQKRIRKLETALKIVASHSGKTEGGRRKQFEVVSETIPVPMIISAESGEIVFANLSAQKIFCYSHDDFVGVKASSLYCNPEALDLFLETLASQGEVSGFRAELRKSEGSVFSATLSSRVLSFDGQDCVLTVIHDLTELMALESQLHQANKMEAMGTLAGGMAHNFNNILAAILGNAEMVREDISEASSSKELIDEILKAGNRAKELVRHILAFSRKGSQQRISVQIDLLVREALGLLRASFPTTIEIKKNIETNCGNIMAEPTEIHQVVMNLCTNAVQEMGDKGGVLGLVLRSVDLKADDMANYYNIRPGLYAHLSVSDSGAGID